MSTFAITGTIKITFTGRNGAGSISVPGLKAGDRTVNVTDSVNNGYGGQFEWAVSSDDSYFQASNNDLSSTSFTAILIRS